jgi:hypothetical protein
MRMYVASTPYHLVVATALQIAAEDAPALLMYDDQYGFARHVGNLEAAFPNVSIRLLPPYEVSTRLGRVVGSRRSARVIVRSIRESPESVELFAFTPTRADVLRTAHRLRGRVTTVFVEDGLDAYLPHSSTERYARVNLVHHVGTRLVNGFPSPEIFDNTTILDFKEYHVLLPELCRSTIDQSRVRPIAAQDLRAGVTRLRSLTDRFVPDGPPPTDAWFTSHSKYMGGGSNLLGMIGEWSTEARQESEAAVCAVKLHPREDSAALLRGVMQLPVVNFPSWMPAELLLHRVQENCRIRMGLSTFVLSSKILRPTRRTEMDVSIASEHLKILRTWDDSIEAVAQ